MWRQQCYLSISPENAEVLPHYYGTPKFYPSTVWQLSFTPVLRDADVPPLHCVTAKLYPSTAGCWSSTPPLRDSEGVLLLCGTPKFYQPFQSLWDIVNLYLSTYGETAELPEKQATSTTLNLYQCVTEHLPMAANLGVTPPDPFPFSKPEEWIRWIQIRERPCMWL